MCIPLHHNLWFLCMLQVRDRILARDKSYCCHFIIIMSIRMKWTSVLVLALLVAVLLPLSVYLIPANLPSNRLFGRKLTSTRSDEVCKEMELQLEYLQTLMKAEEQKHLDAMERLRAQGVETKRKLDIQRNIVEELERRNRQLIEKLQHLESGGPRRREDDYRLAPDISPYKIRTLNIQQRSEFEVIPYTTFSKDRLYQLEMGMVNKPEATVIGDKVKEMEEVMETALDVLNSDNDGRKYTFNELLEGYTRIERTVGTQYDLYFKVREKKHVFQQVQLFRPFAPLQKVHVQTYDRQEEWINLIVPLAGRIDQFKVFMDMFAETCIQRDQRVFITLVYFGKEGREEAKDILEKVAAKNHYSHYKFIEKDEQFSRGAGLLAGAEAWDQGNVLLFFCDVDIVFEASFLDRCRLNAAPSSKLFYPIVFSLYNPSVVYSDHDTIPTWKDQLVLTRESGFWRTFGFGMTCMYRADFLFMRGFDTNIHGWGFEDVQLYRKFIQSSMEVIRAPDHGIFHLWHEKKCDPLLPPAQYRMCLGSKARSEASHEHLGRLAFKDLISENEKLHHQFDNMD